MRWITDGVQLVPYNSIYSRVFIHDLELLAHARNRDGDELLERLRDTGRILCSRHWERTSTQDNMTNSRNGSVKRSPFTQFSTGDSLLVSDQYSWRRPISKTRRFTGSGARCQFKQDQEFSQSLRFSEHQNGRNSRSTMAPMPNGRRNANRHLDLPIAKTRGISSSRLKQHFGDKKFLWQANKSMPGNPFQPNGQRLPNKPHGLNAYSEIHNLVFICPQSSVRPLFQIPGDPRAYWRRCSDAPSTSRRPISQ